MKAEVLAEWRTRLADRTLITLPAGAVERLLDERLRLHEALHATRKALDDSVDECGSGGRSEEAWDALERSLSAIAFADEP